MKTLKLLGAAWMLLIATSQTALSQANTKLSNLVSPTAVNQHLLPNNNNSKDLGANNKRWRNLFLSSKIGININPAYPIDISNTTNDRAINVLNTTTGEGIDRVGVYSFSRVTDGYGIGSLSTGGYIGVEAIADAGAYTGGGFGVYAYATGTTGTRYGIYAQASGGTTNYAGYFSGDIYVTGSYLPSDRKLKNNISSIKGSLEQLMKLKPSEYEYKTTEYADMALPKGKQMGLIADEVKAEFPGLVKEAVQPAKYGKDRTEVLRPEVRYNAVNYTGLIPVMIAAIQEQQQTIDAVKAENAELKSRLSAIEQSLNISSKQSTIAAVTLSDARLETNTPNPFTQKTVINYFLPQKVNNAALTITDMNGKLMKTVTLTQAGKGQVVVEAGQLSAGTYKYALIVNGQLIDAKSMVLTR